jgi:hypothetical protein
MSTTIRCLKNISLERKRRFSNHTFVILIFDGAGGEPGKHVLNAAVSLHGPRPHEFTAAIRSL